MYFVIIEIEESSIIEKWIQFLYDANKFWIRGKTLS